MRRENLSQRMRLMHRKYLQKVMPQPHAADMHPAVVIETIITRLDELATIRKFLRI